MLLLLVMVVVMMMMLCSIASSQASVEGDGILSGRTHRSFRSQLRAMLLQQPIATTRQDDM